MGDAIMGNTALHLATKTCLLVHDRPVRYGSAARLNARAFSARWADPSGWWLNRQISRYHHQCLCGPDDRVAIYPLLRPVLGRVGMGRCLCDAGCVSVPRTAGGSESCRRTRPGRCAG